MQHASQYVVCCKSRFVSYQLTHLSILTFLVVCSPPRSVTFHTQNWLAMRKLATIVAATNAIEGVTLRKIKEPARKSFSTL